MQNIFILVVFILFLMFIFLLAKYIDKKQYEDNNYILKLSKIFVLLPFLILILFFFNDLKQDKTESKADGFTISYYNLDLNINKNNVINVSENIGINFYESNHHGIYTFVPEWLFYTSYKGSKVKRKSVVSNLREANKEYSIDTVKNKKRIKIGSSSEFVGIGLQDYNILYDYDMGEDPFKGYDEFIFHAYGDYWGTEINNASVKITMPETIKKNKISFYLDKDRKYEVTNAVDIGIDNNIIYANFNKIKYNKLKDEKCKNNKQCTWPENLNKSLTISIILPDNYFTSTSNNYTNNALIFIIISFILFIINFILWLIFGKDHEKKEIVSRYMPPKNYSSAEVGYIYGKQSSKKLTISLIVELAAKKMLKINESKNKVILTNLNPMPSKEIVIDRKVILEKFNDLDENYNKEFRKWFNNLFKNSNVATIKDDFKIFDKYFDLLEKNKIVKIKEYPKTIKHNDNYEDEIKQYNINIDKLNEYEKIVYNSLFLINDEIILKEHETFYTTFRDISSKLEKELKWIINDKTSSTIKPLTKFISILSLILSLIAFFIVKDLNPRYYNLYYVSFILSFMCFLFSIFMDRKTTKGEEIYSEVLGFKDFINNVEKDKLEELVSEMPDYFYDILPYAYVFNVSKKWIKKFENIKIPKTDIGNFDIGNISSISSNISYPSTTYSSTSSSCGGGCSSCGGGCSSCGGGGSW